MMIQFQRGDPENLEGRVLIYSNVGMFNRTEQPIVRAGYGTNDLDDLFKTATNLGLENTNGVKESLTEALGEDPKRFDITKAVPFYWMGFDVPASDESIHSTEGNDVIFIGAYNHQVQVRKALHSVLDFYVQTYVDQRLSRGETMGRAYQSTANRLEVRLTPNATHNDFSRTTTGEIGDYLLTTYVVPLLDAARNGQSNVFDKLSEEFDEFSVGSHFTLDVQHLSILIKDAKGIADPRLVAAYVNKMDAIHREDYLGAAAQRDQIMQMVQTAK